MTNDEFTEKWVVDVRIARLLAEFTSTLTLTHL